MNRRPTSRLVAVTAVLAVALIASLSLAGAASAALWTSDPPGAWTCSKPNNDCVAHTGFKPTNQYWGQATNARGNCTNYAAYRLIENGASSFLGSGNAVAWRDWAKGAGKKVDGTPAVGSIAWWGSSYHWAGHVAYVEKVSANGSIHISESVWNSRSARKVLTPGQSGWPHAFLHIKDKPTGKSPIGKFERVEGLSGNRLRVVGWALDPDGPSKPVQIEAWIDGKRGAKGARKVALGWANATRSDVARAHRGAGAQHGFNDVIKGVAPGKHTVHVYALNRFKSGDITHLGGKTVRVPAPPAKPKPSPAPSDDNSGEDDSPGSDDDGGDGGGGGTDDGTDGGPQNPTLPAPAGLTIAGVTGSSVQLSWNASSGATGYRVFVNDSQVNSTTTTSYTFSGLSCGTNYKLGVEAFNDDGASSRPAVTVTTSACSSTPPPPPPPPGPPTGLSASGATTTSIKLSWSAPTTGGKAVGYNLYRDGSKVASTTSKSYTFTKLSCGKKYKLGVAAYDSGGRTSATVSLSNVPTATCPPPTYSQTTGGVTNTWTNYKNAGGTKGQTIPAFTTVKISCRITGFKVADGNTWWYRIASSPWSNKYYASADAFYNNGKTSGSLIGTPFVDTEVPKC